MSDDPTLHSMRTTLAGAAGGELELPASLGPVRLVREIGRGAMGVVWLGFHELLKKDVAIKFISAVNLTAEDPLYVRFLDGARAAGEVRHPGLTLIHHADLLGGMPYLVMDYVEGPTLSDVLRRCGGLSATAAVAALRGVAAAVAALHERDIVHRDIKPANVLLDAAGRTYVTDFGLACERPARGAVRLAGTPAYMAPEMFDGVVSPRSDVYALGIMTYELLTGHVPFAGAASEVRRQHSETTLPTAELHGRASAELIDIIERCVHKKPMYRYRSGGAVLRAIEDLGGAVRSGEAELASLVSRTRLGTTSASAPVATRGSSGPYTDELSRLAELRRDRRATGESWGAVSTEHGVGVQPMPPARVAVDVSCANCGYNLRGLDPSAKCSECGADLSASLAPQRLIFVSTGWLRRVARGLLYLYISVILWVPAAVCVVLGSPVLGRLSQKRHGFDMLVAVACSLLALPGLAWLLTVVKGTWLTTTPEPRSNADPPGSHWRLLARVLGILAPVSLGASWIITFWLDRSLLGMVVVSIATFSIPFAIIAFLLYGAALIGRIPDVKRARQLRVIGLLVLVLFGGLFVPALEKSDHAWTAYCVAVIVVYCLAWGSIRFLRGRLRLAQNQHIEYGNLLTPERNGGDISVT